jgi:hypothetical protein
VRSPARHPLLRVPRPDARRDVLRNRRRRIRGSGGEEGGGKDEAARVEPGDALYGLRGRWVTGSTRSSSRQIGLVLQRANGRGLATSRAATGIRGSLSVLKERKSDVHSSGETARAIAAPRVRTGVTKLVAESPVGSE